MHLRRHRDHWLQCGKSSCDREVLCSLFSSVLKEDNDEFQLFLCLDYIEILSMVYCCNDINVPQFSYDSRLGLFIKKIHLYIIAYI